MDYLGKIDTHLPYQNSLLITVINTKNQMKFTQKKYTKKFTKLMVDYLRRIDTQITGKWLK